MTPDPAAPRPARLFISPARSVHRPFSFLLALLVAASVFDASARRAFAQDDPGGHSPDEVLRVRTDLITVPVVVTDSKGRRVPGLSQTDFSVLDNGREVPISTFSAGPDRVTLAFALDTSGSVRELVTQQRDAARQLLLRFGPGSRVAVMHFGEKAELSVPFTTELAQAEPAFSATVPASRRTAIFDAAVAAINAFAAARDYNSAERRILILISDGLDTASTTNASWVVDRAQAYDVSVYVIHLPLYAPRDGQLKVRPPSKGFRELAEKTGGRYFLIGEQRAALDPNAPAPDLAPVFQAIEEDLQGQYVLGYSAHDATAPPSNLHRVEVKLNARDRRKLRARTLREEFNLRPMLDDK
ncbi:MAG TPA: VWA domain-containing protein [Pyrinomonadaceae bacterium]|nr:VWA domain-containing protein [Pyrinomonadaceae bacterium]